MDDQILGFDGLLGGEFEPAIGTDAVNTDNLIAELYYTAADLRRQFSGAPVLCVAGLLESLAGVLERRSRAS